MSKAEIRALGKIFVHDIEQALEKPQVSLPFQSKAKIYKKLEADGMVKQTTATIGFATLTGWDLTTLGHMVYCFSCEDDEGEHLRP